MSPWGEPPAIAAAATGPARRARQRLVARLEGGWHDPAAWRVLQEELVRAWCEQPGVVGAAIVVRGAAATAARAACVACEAATAAPVWSDLPPRTDALWLRIAAATDRTFWGDVADTDGWGLPAGLLATARGWLVAALPARSEPELALVLALASPVTADPVRDAVVTTGVAEQADLLAPLLGDRYRLAALASQVAGARAEIEVLARLDGLRSRLAAVTAHELRTPLTSIVAYADVLLDNVADPEFPHAHEFLTVIRGETDRLVRMVDRLLDFSRQERSQPLLDPRPCAVPALLQETATTLAPQAAAAGLRLRVRHGADLPAIAGDPDLVRQVLINLAGNAVKYTPRGGRITLAAREDAAMIRISIADTGPGIPPGELRAIFQSFYRSRAAAGTVGTGLGLSIVKDIVDLHDGYVDVRSRLGRGSIFSVLLPKAAVVSPRTELLAIAGADDEPVRRILRHGLRLLAELTGARGTAIALVDPQSGDLWPVVSQGLPAPDQDRPLLWEGTPLGRALAGAEAAADDGGLPALPWPAAGETAGEWATAPLALQGRVLGVVIAARRRSRGRFGRGDARAMVRVVGEALGNALAVVTRPGATVAEAAAVDEALRTLGSLRRSGVPTAAPLALRLLARTARSLGLSSGAVKRLQYAAAVHDAGMVPLAPEIASKPTRLSPDERDEIGRHPARGVDLLRPLIGVPELHDVILHHHERVDGTGYPEGRRGGEIPLGARILAVVDAFFAMISRRPWRAPRPLADVVAEIRGGAGTQFDTRVVEAFVRVLREEGLLAAAGPRRPRPTDDAPDPAATEVKHG